jgi:hypothetical protein
MDPVSKQQERNYKNKKKEFKILKRVYCFYVSLKGWRLLLEALNSWKKNILQFCEIIDHRKPGSGFT